MPEVRYAPMNEADSAHTITGKGDMPLVWGSATSATSTSTAHRRRVILGATVATRGPSTAGGENDVLEKTTSLYIGSGLSLLDSVHHLKRSSPHLPTHDVSR